MTQLSVMELAKKGDPQAIATLINRSLASKGIHAEAQLETDCLKISLKASQIPNQKAVVTIIHRGMMILQVEQIKHVKILTYRSDNNYLAWQHEISLGNSPQEALSNPQMVKNSDLVQDQNKNLISNQKGVILVEKLSQIQQNLQEYQDIIVRFTDEHVGTVRCLTTLTELIQVISKPSFLFAAVASNPNLRSLLDTIAESSKTDEHGDQIITNLSILQPGQQWQKAKIRLVTKIFLEPAQDQDNAQDKHQGITVDLPETVPQSIAYPELSVPKVDIPDTEIPKPEIPQSISEYSDDNLESEFSSESVTTNSLFDDFPDTSVPIARVIDDVTEIPNLSDSFDNLESEFSSESVTANSLFDDFPDTSAPVARVIDDVTEIPNLSDSLFDDFIDVGDRGLSSNLLDEISPTDIAEDLFDNFAFSSQSPDINSLKSEETSLEGNIDLIKSRISKQNLDQLLMLMEEEENTKIESQTSKDKVIDKSKKENNLDSDFGATTIESILGNMQTINLNGTGETSMPDFVTLEKFSEDMDSSGF